MDYDFEIFQGSKDKFRIYDYTLNPFCPTELSLLSLKFKYRWTKVEDLFEIYGKYKQYISPEDGSTFVFSNVSEAKKFLKTVIKPMEIAYRLTH